MSGPTSIRASVKDGETAFNILVQHDKKTGRRRDEAGSVVQVWYITEVKVRHNISRA